MSIHTALCTVVLSVRLFIALNIGFAPLPKPEPFLIYSKHLAGLFQNMKGAFWGKFAMHKLVQYISNYSYNKAIKTYSILFSLLLWRIYYEKGNYYSF